MTSWPPASGRGLRRVRTFRQLRCSFGGSPRDRQNEAGLFRGTADVHLDDGLSPENQQQGRRARRLLLLVNSKLSMSQLPVAAIPMTRNSKVTRRIGVYKLDRPASTSNRFSNVDSDFGAICHRTKEFERSVSRNSHRHTGAHACDAPPRKAPRRHPRQADDRPRLAACGRGERRPGHRRDGQHEIADAVKGAGGEAVMTRADHASGSDRIHEAVMKVDPARTAEIIVNLQGDLPTSRSTCSSRNASPRSLRRKPILRRLLRSFPKRTSVPIRTS